MQMGTPVFPIERDVPPATDSQATVLRELMFTVETTCGFNFEWLFDRLEQTSE